jgi:hypothetical protein
MCIGRQTRMRDTHRVCLSGQDEVVMVVRLSESSQYLLEDLLVAMKTDLDFSR